MATYSVTIVNSTLKRVEVLRTESKAQADDEASRWRGDYEPRIAEIQEVQFRKSYRARRDEIKRSRRFR